LNASSLREKKTDIEARSLTVKKMKLIIKIGSRFIGICFCFLLFFLLVSCKDTHQIKTICIHITNEKMLIGDDPVTVEELNGIIRASVLVAPTSVDVIMNDNVPYERIILCLSPLLNSLIAEFAFSIDSNEKRISIIAENHPITFAEAQTETMVILNDAVNIKNDLIALAKLDDYLYSVKPTSGLFRVNVMISPDTLALNFYETLTIIQRYTDFIVWFVD